MNIENLIGVWNFKKSILMDRDKNILPDDPVNKGTGLIIYTNTGHMAVQLQMPKIALENSSIHMQMDYIAYYGKYNYDSITSVVTHYIVASNIYEFRGKTVTRLIKEHNESLISLTTTEPEKLAVDEFIYRELFWQRLNT